VSLVLLTSAKGAPGVTTAAVALAVNWPARALLVEADPSGTSSVLAGYLRGQLPHDRGILDAAVAVRAGNFDKRLPSLLVDLPPSGLLLAGLTRPEQASTMSRSWDQLAVGLVDYARGAGVDVIVDAGRLGSVGYPVPLFSVADQVLLVTGSTLPALHATRAWIRAVAGELFDESRLGLLLVGEGNPYLASDISVQLRLPVAAKLAWDPAGARQWSAGAAPGRRLGDFARSLARAVDSLASNRLLAG
jgi:hypothetical protein